MLVIPYFFVANRIVLAVNATMYLPIPIGVHLGSVVRDVGIHGQALRTWPKRSAIPRIRDGLDSELRMG